MTKFGTLMRHFARLILAPPLLTDLGVDYLRRTIASVVAILFVTGIFLPRLFIRKYTLLGGDIVPDAYLRALEADTLLMIAVPMLVIGLVSLVLTPMLFPDATDYHVLAPLPVTRRQIFGAKLAAIIVVVLVGIVAINVITSIWFPLVSMGSFRRAPYGLGPRMAAHGVAAVSGSIWMFSAVMALQGVCLIALPDRLRARAGLLLQAGLFLLLLLTVPLVLRIPSLPVSRDTVGVAPLVWLPPVWFTGVEQWMLGGDVTGGYQRAAAIAAVATVSTVAVVVVAYVRLYRSAECLAGISGVGRSGGRRFSGPIGWIERRFAAAPVTAAVVTFAARGLTRSRLHQFVFLLIVGAGGAGAIGHISAVIQGDALLGRGLDYAAIAAPLLVALSITLGLRQAWLLPKDPAAAWLFRLTERGDARAEALDGVAFFFRVAALVPAIIVAAVLQPAVFGNRWLGAAALCALASLLLVELVMIDWARIPYTCSYLPGKRVLAYTLGVVFAAYAIFVYIGSRLLSWAILHPSRMMLLGGLLIAVVAHLRRARLRVSSHRPLEFEDEDPLAVRSLGLLPDEH